MQAVLILLLKIVFAEARVFCQDSNAMPWRPAGYSCPLTCNTIIAAIDRLKQSDYQYLIKEHEKKDTNISKADIFIKTQKLYEEIFHSRRTNSLHSKTQTHLKLFHTYHRLLSNKNFIDGLKMEAKRLTAELNMTCSNMAAEEYIKKIGYLKCSRKFYKRPDVVEEFTKFLNKFADVQYPFDEVLAGNILQKLEGSLTRRSGVVDFKTILAYLRKFLIYHRSRGQTDRVLKLQSKNCLTINVPGCYCKLGFVERNLQCVKPEDCIPNSIFKGYLKRIILH